MTILPKKKAEQQKDSDNEQSSDHSASPHGASGHASHSSPHPLESPYEDSFSPHHHRGSPETFYHRRYDLSSGSSSSSRESSPELPALSKRGPSYRSSPSSAASARGKKPPADSSPYYSGYNSSEEYDGTRRPYMDIETERQFEQTLKANRGLMIKKMRPDGACLFRAVADQVYGDQEMHSTVRNLCMDYMLKNTDYFSQYVTDEDFEHYINRKRFDNCYGNNIEMQAIAEIYNRSIEVFQYTTEPINIFFGVYKTDNAPIRLSYHGQIHYNSVVDPYAATIGVGLGLAGHQPGLADKMMVGEAIRESENLELEQAMLEDKLRHTDWDATCDAIEEAVTRESYLTWLKENEKRTRSGVKHSASQSTSAACQESTTSRHLPSLPPPISATPIPSSTTLSSQIQDSTHLNTTTTTPTTNITTSTVAKASSHSHPPQSTTCTTNLRGSPHRARCGTPTELHVSGGKVLKSRSAIYRTGSPASSRGSHRGTPSPPSSFTYRSSNSSGTGGSHRNSVRNSPYHSPWDSAPHSQGGSLRGSARNSPHHSPRNSVHGSPSPSPELLNHALVSKLESVASRSSGGRNLDKSPRTSPKSVRRGLLMKSNSDPGSPTIGTSDSLAEVSVAPPRVPSPTGLQTLSASPVSRKHHETGHPPPPPSTSSTTAASPPLPSQQSPPRSVDFESGRVLTQLPFEYSSFLDLPPDALGLPEWEDDRLLAAVLAASQQEYIDSLKRSNSSRGAEGIGQ